MALEWSDKDMIVAGKSKIGEWFGYLIKRQTENIDILARPAFEARVSSTGVHLKLKNKSKGKVAIFLRSSASPSLQFHVANLRVWPREEKCPQNRQTQRVEDWRVLTKWGGGIFCWFL